MHYIVLFILLFYFLIFLFGVYVFSKDNFVLLRKNVNLESMFNISFLVALVGILTARIFYVAFHFKSDYLNPLVFFLVPYFPGLSIAGGVIGACLFLTAYTRRSKIPTLHVLDIFSLSFICALPFGLILSVFYSKMSPLLFVLAALTGIVALLLVFTFQRAKFSDGGVAALSLFFSSLIFYLVHTVSGKFFVQDDFLILLIFGASAYFLIEREKIHKRIKLTFKPKKFEFKLKFQKKVKWREIR